VQKMKRGKKEKFDKKKTGLSIDSNKIVILI